jgi:hypothetical protein
MKMSDDKLHNLFTRRMTQHLSSLRVLSSKNGKHVLDAILRGEKEEAKHDMGH